MREIKNFKCCQFPYRTLHIYIYIYMCVCVCVCVCGEREKEREIVDFWWIEQDDRN